jgi:hypothetical protein
MPSNTSKYCFLSLPLTLISGPKTQSTSSVPCTSAALSRCVGIHSLRTKVWSLEDPTWTCRIDEGSAGTSVTDYFVLTPGLEDARWAPDGRHILTTTEFQVLSLADIIAALLSRGPALWPCLVALPCGPRLVSSQLRITIWSLVSQQTFYIKYPKHAGAGLQFSSDGAYLAVLERTDCKDFVSIFACQSWEMVQHFPVDTVDAADMAWAADGRAVAVWDSPLDFRVAVHAPDGHRCATIAPQCDGLGVKVLVILHSHYASAPHLLLPPHCSAPHLLLPPHCSPPHLLLPPNCSAPTRRILLSCIHGCSWQTVQWAPSGQLLAVGSFDETVRHVWPC